MADPRLAQVGWVESAYHPYAQCAAEGCGWKLARGRTATAAACKRHVADTGHRVHRVKETIAEYYPLGGD